jgi:hypothetical protein
VSEKLNRENYLVWPAQVLLAVRGARLLGLLDGSSPSPAETIEVETADKTKALVDNPAYEQWLPQDQQVLSYLLS